MIEYPNHLKSPRKGIASDDLSTGSGSVGSASSNESSLRDQIDEALRLARLILGKDGVAKSEKKTFLAAIREVASLKQQLEALERERNLLRRAVKATCLRRRSTSSRSSINSAESDLDADTSTSLLSSTAEDMKARLTSWQTAFHNINNAHDRLLKKCQKDLEQVDLILHNTGRREVTGSTATDNLEHLSALIGTVCSFPSVSRMDQMERELQASQTECLKKDQHIERLEARLRQLDMDKNRQKTTASTTTPSKIIALSSTKTEETTFGPEISKETEDRPDSPTDTVDTAASTLAPTTPPTESRNIHNNNNNVHEGLVDVQMDDIGMVDDLLIFDNTSEGSSRCDDLEDSGELVFT